ncbi:MAG: L-idonate 5-dehydrogenase [Chitinophagia bacterium]|nr:L-idonate 5-dehydrogenase [Chitinophagia bacterium]
MKSFLLHGPQDIRLAQRTMPVCDEGQVIVQTKYTGICGSDIHYFRDGFCGSFKPKYPFALGHEFSGIVHFVGEGVTSLSVGDAVAIDPSMPCGACSFCREGQYNLCKNMRFFGSASCDPHQDGSMASYVVAPASNCFVLPQGISLSQASLLEPLSVAMHAVRRAGPIAGKKVLITGGGPIGQLILRVVKAMGAYTITLSDVSEYARAFAITSGANWAINPLENGALQQLDQMDIVLEASGNPAALNNGIQAPKKGGTLVLVGTLPETFAINGNAIMSKQLQVLGSFRFANVFEDAIRMVAAGIIQLDGMITNTYSFDEIPQALNYALTQHERMKIQIVSD